MKFDETKGRGYSLAFIRSLSKECASLGGPVASQLNQLVQRSAFREVVDFEIDTHRMTESSLEDLIYARQIKALVEKQDFLDIGYDREREGWKKFEDAELRCRETNDRLLNQLPKWDVAGVLHTAQRIIAAVLGPVPELADLPFEFGPGASTNVVGRVASFRTKLGAPMQCSETLASSVGEFLEEFPLWCDAVATEHLDGAWRVAVEVRPARLGFVTKTSKTHRAICVEPSLNALGQKGIGTYMKKRLGLFGVDLKDQTRNQDLARKGSIDGSFATIDLSSASDTVSWALVLSLLPPKWFDLLNRFRSERVEYKGRVLELEKFSSMGNAYTFELESLIFYSLALAVNDSLCLLGEPVFDRNGRLGKGYPIVVYGDDIIVPTASYCLLEEVLTWCGFELNSKKSFCYGPFRESCGADWFLGKDVRPWYLKKEISERSLFVAHNFFMRHGERRLANAVLSYIGKKVRLWGPDGYGDGHLIGSYTLRAPAKKQAGWEGGYFRSWKGVRKSYDKPLQTDVLIPSYTSYARMGEDSPTDPYVVRGTKDYRTTSIYTLRRGIFLD